MWRKHTNKLGKINWWANRRAWKGVRQREKKLELRGNKQRKEIEEKESKAASALKKYLDMNLDISIRYLDI